MNFRILALRSETQTPDSIERLTECFPTSPTDQSFKLSIKTLCLS
nr:MAG TPA: hypothetical protein [Caudoviricetes sp.]